MALSFLKSLLPNRSLPLPILWGPFQGAVIQLQPRIALRKVMGVYEHELHDWLKQVLPQITMVLDVGANDGYFTFGCEKVLRELGKPACILAFEPVPECLHDLHITLANCPPSAVTVELLNCYVGAVNQGDTTTLDEIAQTYAIPHASDRALIKIDVEGVELDVLAGASHWLQPQHFFLIEVHEASFLTIITDLFAKQGITLKQVNQRPLPILGQGPRSPFNWWLVSDFNPG
jgi:hypothetical protein